MKKTLTAMALALFVSGMIACGGDAPPAGNANKPATNAPTTNAAKPANDNAGTPAQANSNTMPPSNGNQAAPANKPPMPANGNK